MARSGIGSGHRSALARTLALTVALGLALALALAPQPGAAQEEVPFITTPDHVTLAMLQLARVAPRDFVLDLGSGDGRIVITAAKAFGARGLGVEIVPELVERSRDLARRAGVADRTEFRVQDLFATDLSTASVITMYLLPEVNMQLRPALLKLRPGTRIVSHDWDLGDWRPDHTLVVEVPDKVVGREKLSRLHLWTVPARLQGLWCARAPSGRSASLHVQQVHQQARARLRHPGGEVELSGAIQGERMQLAIDSRRMTSIWRLEQTPAAQRLVAHVLQGDLRPWRGIAFVRSNQPDCGG